MTNTPWMASMLGELLDAIEADPALQARLRRLLAPPIAASPPSAAAAEGPEVTWIGELSPTDFSGQASSEPPRSLATTPSPTPAPATPARPPRSAIPVLPPPPVRGKAPAVRTPEAPRPPDAPRRPTSPPPAAKPAAAPADRPVQAARNRPKTVSLPDVLRALPALPALPPTPPALPDQPATIAPFVVQWLESPAANAEPSGGPARGLLAAGLQRELGSAPARPASRLPADLLQPAGLRPVRPSAIGGATPALPADAARPRPLQPADRRLPLTPASAQSERQRVAELLAGRVAVMIGGASRPEKQEALRRELGLKELRWIGTRAHAPLEPLVTAVSDPEVGLVLLLIRLSSHSFGELAEPCKQRGIPLVRIPGGWGTNQLAHQILDQAGERLAALPAA